MAPTATTSSESFVTAYLATIVIVASCLFSIFALYALIQIVIKRKQASERAGEAEEPRAGSPNRADFQAAKCARCQRRSSDSEFEPNNMACTCSGINKQQFNAQGKIFEKGEIENREIENNYGKRLCEGGERGGGVVSATIDMPDNDTACSLDTVIDLHALANQDTRTIVDKETCSNTNNIVPRDVNIKQHENYNQEETFDSIGQSMSDYEDSIGNENLTNKKWSKIVNKVSLLRRAAKLIIRRGEDDDSDVEDDFLARKLALVEGQSTPNSLDGRDHRRNHYHSNTPHYMSDQQLQQHLDQQLQFEPEYLSSQRLRCSEISIQSNDSDEAANSGDCDRDQQFNGAFNNTDHYLHKPQGATVTTRVLTDDSGHSIKIRIASPPPPRRLHHIMKEQETTSDNNSKRSMIYDGDEDDLGGEDEPMGRMGSVERDYRDACSASQQTSPMYDRDQRNESGFLNGARRKRRRRQSCSVANSDWHANAYSSHRGERRNRAISRPIECERASDSEEDEDEDEVDGAEHLSEGKGRRRSNDSSSDDTNDASASTETDEADEGANCDRWDSRQETSLDGLGSLGVPKSRSYEAHLSDLMDNDDQTVMDADLRIESRLKLEQLMLQQAAAGQHQLGNSQGGSAFPQSGYLISADNQQQQVGTSHSLISFCMSDQQAQQNNFIDSRRSSAMTSATDEATSGGVASTLLDEWYSPLGNGPSLRFAISRLEAPAKTHEQDASEGLLTSSKRQMLRSLARSFGRSQSSESSSAGDESNSSETRFELRLLSAHNLNGGGARASGSSRPISPVLGGSRSRRDSFQVESAAEQAAGGRRNSADSYYVRLFKGTSSGVSVEQTSFAPATTTTSILRNSGNGKRLSLSSLASLSTIGCDNISIHSSQSMVPAMYQASGFHQEANFIQLPTLVCKQPAKSTGNKNANCAAANMIDFEREASLNVGQPKAFTIDDLRYTDFPLRISLYQVSGSSSVSGSACAGSNGRRGHSSGGSGGSRLTIGHCVLTRAHLEALFGTSSGHKLEPIGARSSTIVGATTNLSKENSSRQLSQITSSDDNNDSEDNSRSTKLEEEDESASELQVGPKTSLGHELIRANSLELIDDKLLVWRPLSAPINGAAAQQLSERQTLQIECRLHSTILEAIK